MRLSAVTFLLYFVTVARANGAHRGPSIDNAVDVCSELEPVTLRTIQQKQLNSAEDPCQSLACLAR